MACLELRSVAKSYDKRSVVMQPFSIKVGDGEFVVIVGPSGCGKSTLLRMVAGLESVTSGEILIGNKLVTHIEPKDRGVAMVFQNYALYPHMSVYDNMAYGLKINKVEKRKIKERVEQVAKILDLGPLLGRKPKELSGGQRQRVAMGRAIVREPSLFLFDEPLSNLDAKLRVQMRLELQQFHRRQRTTSLYVTHDQVEAMTLADRVIILNKGYVQQIGTPEEIYGKPYNLFVAGFMGSPSMNLLPGVMSSEGSHFSVDGGFELPLPFICQQYKGKRFVLGIRPEHISISTDEGFPIIVQMLELLGADNLIHARWGNFSLVIRVSHDVQPKLGDHLRVDFPVTAVHLFDNDTGERIEK